MVILKMDSWRAKESCTSQQVIIILVSSNLIKKKAEGLTIGLENRIMYMRVSSRVENGMEEELFGGRMEVGTKEDSEKVCRRGLEFYIERTKRSSIKVNGWMVCSTDKANSSFRMDRNMKVILNRINSMVTECFIKMTRLFTGFGRIMNFQWLIWSNLPLKSKNDDRKRIQFKNKSIIFLIKLYFVKP